MKVVNMSEAPSVINQYLSELRDVSIQQDKMRFRHNLERIGEMMAYEISKDLNYKETEVKTPLAPCKCKCIAEGIVLATIFRAGLPLHQGFLNVFDNGTIYSITHIPDEFYTWLTHREIFIDPYDGIVECNYCNNDWVEVIYPDASWNVPGGKYVRATPRSATVNPEIKYHCAEVIPGVSYKLQVIFAPETLSEDTLPSKVFVDLYTNTLANRIIQNEVISAEEVTTLEADNIIVLSSGMDVAIRSHVSSKEKKDYNRVLRVAGIRLIPVDN